MAAITSSDRVLAVEYTGNSGSQVTLSGPGSGLGQIDIGSQGTVRDIPGEGNTIIRQVLEFRTNTFALPCERNSVTSPWFDTSAEQALTFTYQPEGNVAGATQFVIPTLLRSTISAAVNDVQTFTLQITVDGNITTTTL